MKKKNIKIKDEIKQFERKNIIDKITGGILIIFSFLMLYVMYNEEYFIINQTTINNLLHRLYYILTVLFGNMLIIFLVIIILLGIVYIKDIKLTVKKIIYILLFFITLSSYMTITKIVTVSNEGIFEVGRKLLEFGFESKGAGLFGALVSIPLYAINNNVAYQTILIFLAGMFLFLTVYELFKNLYMIVSTTLKYRNSEEYKNKLRLINTKRKYEEELRLKEQREKEEKMKNIFVDKTRQKLDDELLKKPKINNEKKQEYYSEEELKKKKAEWTKYIEELERKKQEEAIKKRELEIEKEVEEFKSQSIKNDYIDKVYEEKESNIIKPLIEKEILTNNVIEEKNNKEEEQEKQNYIIKEKTIEVEEKPVVKNYIRPLNNNLDTTNNKFIDKTIEENKENYEVLQREELRKSIEEVFVYKKMDESQKEEMLKNINHNIEILEKTLMAYGVEAKVVDYATGPTVTRYEITIPSGTRVKKVTSLADEICMNLSAESIRFEAPIPGKSTIGIETPNKLKETVYFSNLIHSEKINKGELSVVLGKDIVGREMIIDIAKMPHLLIAGQTGSGKSVAINTILATLISKKMPDEVKFILVDPKMVELMPYNDIPHLLVPVIIEPEQAAIALKWAEVEMDERYKKLSRTGVRKIEDYNKKNPNDKLPYIVIIIDELADLMMVSASSVEVSIARIAQKARAVGIHLIVATQRPSTDVITGMIKANLPSRISFALRSQIDSRTILDQTGAEKLLGKGDMLILQNGSSKLERVQGAFISDEEVYQLTDVLKSTYTPQYNMDILVPKDEEDNSVDPLYEKAIELVDEVEDRVSINMLQINLKLGFNRARNLFNMLKENGILDENGYKN